MRKGKREKERERERRWVRKVRAGGTLVIFIGRVYRRALGTKKKKKSKGRGTNGSAKRENERERERTGSVE